MGLALGDLNGDKQVDAFISTTSGQQIWLNDWAGSGKGVLTNVRNLTGTGAHVVMGDVNGDGHLDVIADKVYINDGNAIFTAGQSLSGYSLGDVDADGDLDLLGTSLWKNNGAGTFTASQSLGGTGALGDVDGDGDLDAYVIKPNGNEVWRNDGSGTFTNTFQSLGSSDSRAVDLGDLDGDGDLDAFVGNGSSQSDRIWFNDGRGVFTDQGSRALPGYARCAARRFGRGRRLGRRGGRQDGTRIGLNDGHGAMFFAPGQSYGGGVALATGDINDDGPFDAFVGKSSGSAQVLLNQNTPMFAQDRFEFNNSSGSATNLDTVHSILQTSSFRPTKG